MSSMQATSAKGEATSYRGRRPVAASRGAFQLVKVASIASPLLVFVMIAFGVYVHLQAEMRATIAQTSQTIAQYSLRAFEAQDRLIDATLEAIGDKPWDAIAADAALPGLLRAQANKAAVNQSIVLLRTDTNRVVTGTGGAPATPIDVADRDYMRAAHDNAPGLFIGESIVTRPSGYTTFTMSRCRKLAGRCDGVALVGFQLDYFFDYYRTLLEGRAGAVTLVRADGLVLARWPESSSAPVSINISQPSVSEDVDVDGRARLQVVRRLGDYPVAIVFAADLAGVRQPWLQAIAPLALVCLGAASLLLLLTRQLERTTKLEGQAQARAAALVELQRSSAANARLAALVRAAADPIISLMPDGTITGFNPAAEALTGLSAQEAIGASVFAASRGEALTQHRAMVKRVLAGEIVRAETVRLVRGRECEVDVNMAPVRNAEGRVVEISSTLRDISARKQSERAMRAMQDTLDVNLQRFDLATRAADITVFDQDRERRFTWVSRDSFAAGRDVVGLRDEDVLPPETARAVAALKDEVIASGQAAQADVSGVIDGVQHWWQVRAEPRRDAAGIVTGLLGVSINITKDREREAQIARLSLDRAQALARLETALGAAEIILSEQDLDRRYRWMTRGGRSDHLGVVVGQREEDLPLSAGTEAIIKLKEAVIATRTPQTQDIHIGLADHEIWVRVSVEPRFDQAGVMTGLLTWSLDITAEKRAQLEAQSASDRLALALEAGRIGSFDWDMVADRVTWSAELEHLFGLGPGGFAGGYEAFEQRVHSQDRAAVRAVIDDAVKARRSDIMLDFRAMLPDGATIAIDSRARVTYGADGAPLRMVGVNIDVTAAKRQEEQVRFLMRELSHRAKNLLAVVQAMARQTAATSSSTAEFQQRFSDRIQALASSHDLLTRDDWLGSSVGELVALQIKPFMEAAGGRIAASGPVVRLTPEAAQNIGLALHELATNAAKYGALSNAGGTVAIAWALEGEPGAAGRTFAMTWRETNGPVVYAPNRRGFGQMVMERIVARALHGTVALDFPPTGVHWALRIPATHAVER